MPENSGASDIEPFEPTRDLQLIKGNDRAYDIFTTHSPTSRVTSVVVEEGSDGSASVE